MMTYIGLRSLPAITIGLGGHSMVSNAYLYVYLMLLCDRRSNMHVVLEQMCGQCHSTTIFLLICESHVIKLIID